MNEIFKNIDAEKRDRIINSALEEFSKNSFEKASTNTMVKNAGVSKGSLFHYFKNKKELYEKLEEFMIETVTEAVKEKIDWAGTDFFNRIQQIVIAKGQVTLKYPYIYDFATVVMQAKPIDAVRKKAEQISPDLTNQVLTYNIDFSKFKEGIDLEKTMDIIRWTFEKFGEEQWQKVKMTGEIVNFQEIEKQFQGYTDLLKKVFYKAEFIEK